MRWLRDNSLSLFFAAIFLASLAGQSVAGLFQFNEEATAHGEPTISWGRYVLSSQFGGDVLENWQSEFLQFSLFIVATIWLIQKGSNESKKPEDVGRESEQQQKLGQFAQPNSPRWARYSGGFRRWVYSNSLMLVMTAIFFASWFGQSVSGWTSYNDEQKEHKEQPVAYTRYLWSSDFWDRSLQNWQSEFLAVGTMAAFTIYLRQRGSPESKPVGSPHDQTAASG